MVLELLLLVLVTLALSLGLNRVMLAIAPRLGLMDQPGVRRIHVTPIPRAGGLAIWLSFIGVMAGGLASGWLPASENVTWGWLGAFVAGSGVLVVAGFLDDRKGLSAWVKLGAHVLAPTVLFLLHPVKIGVFPAHWPWLFDFALFVGWTVLLINAFNLIDGLDGLCGGLAAVAVFALAGLALANDRSDAVAPLIIMGGAILGFLKFNLNPARIFLGDAGSMTLGFFLATVATEAVGRKAVLGMILLPIAVAGVPLVDVLLAIWRRSAKRMLGKLRGEENGDGVFDADSQHLHHRLLANGVSQRKVALLLQGGAILLTALAFMPMLFGNRMLGLSLVGFLIVLLVGVRNLARVEMEHTGNVIHMAIKLPGRRRRVAALLFAYDLVVLCLAGFAAVVAETNLLLPSSDWHQLLRFVLLFAISGSITLLVSRVHQRLWVRATMRNLLALQVWILIAVVVSFSLFSLMYATMEWSALRVAAMSYVFACSGICMPRVALDLFRELGFEARHHNSNGESGSYGPVVVFGAGDLGALFLEHLKSSDQNFYPGLRVVGFLDESRILWGRHLRSFKILGGLSSVPKLVKSDGLKGIVVAMNEPRQELLDQLDALAAEHDLRIYRWRVGLDEGA
ncbi:MAG: hypothetical protein RLZZ522_679 [Verrucomicrobiota bacterium]